MKLTSRAHKAVARSLAPIAATAVATGFLFAGGAVPQPAGATTLPSVSISDVSVVEGAAPNLAPANMTVSLSAPSATPVDVRVTLDTSTSTTATPNVDWIGNDATLRFDPG